mgnify:CR=1 FL=1
MFKEIKVVIYLLVILTFSLFILLPVKFRIILFKRRSDEYIRVEIDCYRVSKIFLEIPKIKFIIKNLIPLLSFEYHIGSKNNRIPKSERIVISPLRDRYKIVINMIKVLFKHINNLKKIIRFLSKHINVLYFSINITFGSEDAALTGFLAGQVWSIIYVGLSTVSFYLNFDNTNIKINVIPVFTKHEPLQIDINCIFQLRVGHIIIASFFTVWYLLLSKISSIKSHVNYKLYDKKERRGYG